MRLFRSALRIFGQFYSNLEIILTSNMSGKIKCEAQNVNSTNMSRKAITLEIKHEILSHHESGMKVNGLVFIFELSQSTVSTILKDKEKYLREVTGARPMQSTVIR
jgi:Asp-tRNA(Asn)/Glu-tRNA(Gln) amidotransferase B subunit